MNEQQAINLVSEVCAESNGNLDYHRAVQEALNIIMSKAFPKPVKIPTEKPETIKPNFGGKKE